MHIQDLGDAALAIRIGEGIDEVTRQAVQLAWRRITAAQLPGVVEAAPAYGTVTVWYDLERLPGVQADPVIAVERLKAGLAEALRGGGRKAETSAHRPLSHAGGEISRTVEIPVCYGGGYGPDLELVANRAGLPAEEVCRLHASAGYLVHLIGFSPGFPYLGGLPVPLHTPRQAQPRIRVPAGSVAIAGAQAGIYPIETPGGWNLIGRTPLKLFRPTEDPPSLLAPGDRVRFHPISPEEFARAEACA